MKYMVLMTANKDGWDDMSNWSEDDMQKMFSFMEELNEELSAKGELVRAAGLTGPSGLKTVRTAPDGEAIITDGPFPETKEVLAGFWILEVDSEQRVLELAKRISICPGKGGKPANQPVEVHRVEEQNLL
ncbi:YciI family protein [Kribbella deserti]|uniref:YciI family protein n=1 Tax=Kribbella deserti TaxID=1926257 RepID=A0ABV6QXJ1_9ACTN